MTTATKIAAGLTLWAAASMILSPLIGARLARVARYYPPEAGGRAR